MITWTNEKVSSLVHGLRGALLLSSQTRTFTGLCEYANQAEEGSSFECFYIKRNQSHRLLVLAKYFSWLHCDVHAILFFMLLTWCIKMFNFYMLSKSWLHALNPNWSRSEVNFIYFQILFARFIFMNFAFLFIRDIVLWLLLSHMWCFCIFFASGCQNKRVGNSFSTLVPGELEKNR